MSTRTLSHTDLKVFPLCLGGNVFGWTANEEQSFSVLDAFRAASGNFIDTADMYSAWVAGHVGGESESIIGRWLTQRGGRDRVIIATKVAKLAGFRGLSAQNIRRAAEASLKRLQTDYIDLYYAHEDDPSVPLEETLTAFDALVREGKVRYIAASNFDAERLSDSIQLSKRLGLARYVALQPHYNLVERDEYERTLRPAVQRDELACLPYFALARGFLSGKYRHGTTVDSPRAEGAKAYLNARGLRVLAALDELAASRGASLTALSVAWLREQPTVAAPIASARNQTQLKELLEGATLKLSPAELQLLSAASES